MLHVRNWSIEQAVDEVDVAKKIKANAYIDCYGVQFNKLLFINDSTDCGIREFAVIDASKKIQVDSWTIDWMNSREISHSVLETLNGELKPFATFVEFDKCMISTV